MLTLLLWLACMLWLDFGRDKPSIFPVGTFLFILFAPICLLLWRKENIRDYNTRTLMKYSAMGLGTAILMAVDYAVLYLLNSSDWNHQRFNMKGVSGILLIFIVAGGIFLFMILLSFMRLGIKHLLGLILGFDGERSKESNVQPGH